MKNQVRWFCRPQEYEEPNEWTFVVINARKRELETRRARILTELRSVEDYTGPIDGRVNQTYYRIMRFLSHSVPDDRILSRLYKGKIVEDRKISEKRNNTNLESYVKSILE